MLIDTVQGQKNKYGLSVPLKVLFDSGSDTTLLNRRALPKGANPRLVEPVAMTGVNSTKAHDQIVLLEGITFPEFSPTKKVSGPIEARVFDNPNSAYDVILGMDVLQVLGIDISCTTKTIVWDEERIPFHPKDYFSEEHLMEALSAEMQTDPLDSLDDEIIAKEAGYNSKIILHSKYDKVDPREAASQQTHLTVSQRNDLANLFAQYEKLFSGKLGLYGGRKIHLEVKDGVTPIHSKPYPVPRHHERVFKDELKRLCDIGVLSKTGPSAWLTPTFIRPKKDGRVRWVSDFRALNKVLKRKVYTLPKITDILAKRPGYEFFSKIDISMQYYTFELDEASKDLCTICTPYGNYRYNRLPMGVSVSPDEAQSIMEDLLRDLEEVDCYLDDIGVFNNSWESHLKSLEKVLTILQNGNFTVNPLKCEWGVKETDWLGYWLTPTG